MEKIADRLTCTGTTQKKNNPDVIFFVAADNIDESDATNPTHIRLTPV